ncbi:MAG: aldo/keto reductase family protein [Ktedonobacterales bacterium]
MDYRRLGDAGIKVSAVALGGWINYGEGKVPQESAREVVEAAHDAGINYFDLADVYGNGNAEEQMGALLSRYPRHTLVMATKVYFPMSDDPNDQGLSRKHIMESIDKSLRHLGTDYVDLYFCHRPDPETPILETARAMNDLIRQGKVLYWGTSLWSEEQLRTAYDLCKENDLTPPQVEQPRFSMLYREPVESTILPLARGRGMGVVVFSPLAQGMLTGKYDQGVPEGTRFQQEGWAREQNMTSANVTKVKRLKPIADELGITRGQLALAWILAHDGVSCAITGATRPEQVRDNARAAEVTLSADVMQRIEQALAASAPPAS